MIPFVILKQEFQILTINGKKEINAFGNSLKEGHPHSTDQAEMYVNQQTKKVELDLDVLRKAGEMYHPK